MRKQDTQPVDIVQSLFDAKRKTELAQQATKDLSAKVIDLGLDRQLAHAVMQSMCAHVVVNDGTTARCRPCRLTRQLDFTNKPW